MGSTPKSFIKYNGVLAHKTLYCTHTHALNVAVCSYMSTFFAGCLPDAGKPACISSWFGVALGGSQQTGMTARAGSGTHRAPGSEEDSLNPGSEEKEEEQPQAQACPMSLCTPRDMPGTSGMQTVLANYSI